MADDGLSSLTVKSPLPFRAVDSVYVCPIGEVSMSHRWTGSRQKFPSDS